jgi:hypothetical protein
MGQPWEGGDRLAVTYGASSNRRRGTFALSFLDRPQAAPFQYRPCVRGGDWQALSIGAMTFRVLSALHLPDRKDRFCNGTAFICLE